MITALTSVTSVIAMPDTVDVDVDAHATIIAMGYNAFGVPMIGMPPTWSSADPSIADVTQTGDVHGVAVGATTLTVTISGTSAQVYVRVRPSGTTGPVATVIVSPSSASLAVNGTAQLTAIAKDANGNTLGAKLASWSSSNAAAATVNASGLVSAVAVGSATITATVDNVPGNSAITVSASTADVCDPAYAPPSQPALPGGISVQVSRLDAGCGTVLVSNGIPLAPGALTAAQASQLRLFVGGTEQALYVEPLQATHSDGSLRAVLVQFNYALAPGKPVQAQLVLGQSRGTTDIGKPSASRTSPLAVALPTSPSYLVSTKLVGPTITVSAATQLSATHAKYEQDFVTFANLHWTQEGSNWVDNYYDRALIYYAWWIRSANLEYWKRATAHAVAYRHDYLEVNNYGTSAHWSQIEGVEMHYLLTGDESSRYAVGRVADVFSLPYYMNNLANLPGEMDNRIQAKLLTAFLSAWRTNAQSQSGNNWSSLLTKALTDILASQDASGAYRWSAPNNQCGFNKPFMVGMLNDAMLKYYTYFNADTRIPPSIQKAVDYMWSNDWNATSKAFVYLDGPCPGVDEGQVAAPDLNNLILNGFAWTYFMTHTEIYRTRADDVFTGAVNGAWLNGSKQFNQQYTSSFRYLSYRQ